MSGAIGGMIAVALVAYFAQRAARSGVDGELRYGAFLKVFGGIMAVLALGMLYVLLFVNHRGQYVPIAGILAFLVISTAYFLLEDARTGGTFDENGISFRTLWSGEKQRQWSDLNELRLNEAMGWYVLKFSDGSKIRVSRLLMGHGRLLEVLAARGFEPDGT